VGNGQQPPLTADERDAIVLAAKSAFIKLKNLYHEITPIIQKYGFTVPSAGVIARDLSEKIETSIVQHCASFSKGPKHCDLSRAGCEWEVKICKDSGLTINQSKSVKGENYIVVNYKANSQVTKVWVLWNSKDEFFSPRKPNTNARALLTTIAAAHIEVIYSSAAPQQASLPMLGKPKAAKAALKVKLRKNTA
jgi:hypothetical protein